MQAGWPGRAQGEGDRAMGRDRSAYTYTHVPQVSQSRCTTFPFPTSKKKKNHTRKTQSKTKPKIPQGEPGASRHGAPAGGRGKRPAPEHHAGESRGWAGAGAGKGRAPGSKPSAAAALPFGSGPKALLESAGPRLSYVQPHGKPLGQS